MSTQLIPFLFGTAPIRVLNLNGAPWFVAKDAAEALGYAPATISNVDKMIAHVPDEWKGRHPVPTPGGTQELWCLSELGLYFFVSRSDKPKALPFQKWVAGEVVPAVRKTGSYSLQPLPVAPPETVTLTKDEYITLLKMQVQHLSAAALPKHRRLTTAEKVRIKYLRSLGLGNAAIGKQVGRSKGTVGSYLRRFRQSLEG